MGDNLDLAWINWAENQTEDGNDKPKPGPVGRGLDELQKRATICELCGTEIEYPFRDNWVAWCGKCARENWEAVSIAIMRLRDDG